MRVTLYCGFILAALRAEETMAFSVQKHTCGKDHAMSMLMAEVDKSGKNSCRKEKKDICEHDDFDTCLAPPKLFVESEPEP